MRLSGSRFTMSLTALAVGVASVVLAVGNGDHAVGDAATTAGPGQIVVQTLDSCKSGLQGSAYELLNAAGTVVSTVGSQGASSPGGLTTNEGCPIQQGDCVNTVKGCLVFGQVPAGDYRLVETAVPGPNATNPDGYAPCNGGSACRWEAADVTVNPDGTIVARVTNVAPNGQVETFPSESTHAQYYAGTPSDPIVFHNFGLAKPGTINGSTGLPNPQCDGLSNANDWSTGTPSSECAFPAAQLATLGSPTKFDTSAEGAQSSWKGTTFPWQVMGDPNATPAHLQEITVSGPASVTALSTFQVSVSGGYTPTLVSTQDPGMSVVPSAGGFAVSLDPVRSAASKHNPGGQITSGTVTITPQGGGGALTVTVNPPSANSNFIENLYHDILGRLGQPGEVGYWSTRMDNGMPGWAVAQAFSVTPEFLTRMTDNDFQQMVGAQPDQGGQAYWVNYLAHNGNNDAIMGSLGSSPGFYAQAGGTDNAWLTALYIKVLHRSAPPGPSDLSYWGAYGPFANNQAARLQVANDMAFSTEQHTFVVQGWYQTFLGRAADSQGLAFWVGQLDHGVLQEVMVDSFTNTPEYYALPAKY